MLRITLSEVSAGAVETVGDVAPGHPMLAGAGVTVLEGLRVRGRFSGAGPGKYYWRASLETRVREDCRRCLAPVDVPVSLSFGLLFVSDSEFLEDDGCYAIPPRTQILDLAPAAREEFLLALPQYVECRPDCKGLCPHCGADLNDGPCGCGARASDPRWDALRALTQQDKD